MNIKTAIEIYDINLCHPGSHMPPDVKDALKLGKEALRAIFDIRRQHPTHTIALLPGETITPSKET